MIRSAPIPLKWLSPTLILIFPFALNLLEKGIMVALLGQASSGPTLAAGTGEWSPEFHPSVAPFGPAIEDFILDF